MLQNGGSFSAKKNADGHDQCRLRRISRDLFHMPWFGRCRGREGRAPCHELPSQSDDGLPAVRGQSRSMDRRSVGNLNAVVATGNGRVALLACSLGAAGAADAPQSGAAAAPSPQSGAAAAPSPQSGAAAASSVQSSTAAASSAPANAPAAPAKTAAYSPPGRGYLSRLSRQRYDRDQHFPHQTRAAERSERSLRPRRPCNARPAMDRAVRM